MGASFLAKNHRRRDSLRVYKEQIWQKAPSPDQIRHVFPNVITIVGMCLGLSAIRFAFSHYWEWSVMCILAASVFDMADGRVARFLGSASDFGAELDSLADFLCYGVAPALVIYFHSLSACPGLGWALCLFFMTCSALRLARFNVYRLLSKKVSWGDYFSVGVPAPGGAFIALLPFFLHFSSGMEWMFPWYFLVTLALGGGLMVSRLPTLVFKRFPFAKHRLPLLLLGVALITGGLFSMPWAVMTVLTVAYIASIPWSFLWVKRRRHLTPS
ncbi:CDP-alcohol phosphatidyltransferase family protein [Candidatus Hepatobacter penaei]|uniref:CDP-alcohol phosphatidyltransferase family protein n=1 Tax=Candidatus Hepatobacter penaei TaxID=1274402 RepID=UPI0006975174|nr:phosphatidylcholine/phosphatidylserine synthase [Candidatus Hepatobacter penaei]TGW15913.1 phosphatidylcholine/phosphatidylserine synthase [bacterium NHP-B]